MGRDAIRRAGRDPAGETRLVRFDGQPWWSQESDAASHFWDTSLAKCLITGNHYIMVTSHELTSSQAMCHQPIVASRHPPGSAASRREETCSWGDDVDRADGLPAFPPAGDRRRAGRVEPNPSDLTDSQWALVEPLLSPAMPGGRPEEHPRPEIVNVILHVVRTGCSWRQLPISSPPWETVYWHFKRWRDDGSLDALHNTLRAKVHAAQGRNEAPAAAISPPRA